MATIALRPVSLSSTSYGGAGESEAKTLKAAETPIPGDLMLLNNAQVEVCGADPSIVSFLSLTDSTGSVPGVSKIVYQRIKLNESYEMNAFHTTAANATVPDSALDGQANYGVVKGTVSGVTAWCLDLEDTTNTVVRLINRKDSATDTYPRLIVQFISSKLTFA